MPDQSFRMTSKNKIENFFVGEYNDIIESQLEANNDNDFQTDETLSKNIKVKIIACCVILIDSLIGMLQHG